MATDDLSEYEQLRARRHEAQCRLTATLLFIRQGICHRRSCRRNRLCGGPMLPSPHQENVVRLHKELGLSGKANAALPACIALQRERLFILFDRARMTIAEVQKKTSDREILELCRQRSAVREELGIYAHLTSPPYHPNSVAKETALKTADEKGMTP